MIAFVISFNPIERKAATISKMVIGLLSCRRKRIREEVRGLAFIELEPKYLNLSVASWFDNPDSVVDSRFNASFSCRLQNISGSVKPFGCFIATVLSLIIICFCGAHKRNFALLCRRAKSDKSQLPIIWYFGEIITKNMSS